MIATPPTVTPHRPTVAWQYALFAGFAVQLLLVLFVTLIGLRQLDIAAHNLDNVADVQMRKQNFAKGDADLFPPNPPGRPQPLTQSLHRQPQPFAHAIHLLRTRVQRQEAHHTP